MSVLDLNLDLDLASDTASPITSTLIEEEDLAYHRERFKNMKIVLQQLRQELVVYKNRCAGVDTVTLMLREAKQDIVNLTRQCRIYETAITNLQNRLSTNGLSNSLNIEETESFVPGASKQIIDNLARENARLRNLLKTPESQSGRKHSKNVVLMKESVENLEIENAQLKSQLDEVQNSKIQIVQEYGVIEKFKKEKRSLVDDNEKDDRGREHAESQVQSTSRSCQTVDVFTSKVDTIKNSLRQMSEQCLQLEDQLKYVHNERELTEEDDVDKQSNVQEEKYTELREKYEQQSSALEEKYVELRDKYDQVVLMNQRWQAHNDTQERQMQLLIARVAELEETDQVDKVMVTANESFKKIQEEGNLLRAQLHAKQSENEGLKLQVAKLIREAKERNLQPKFDMGSVEILKQQIQVCTEDFKIERKDREEAVKRVEQLQRDVASLMEQNDALKNENRSLRTTILQIGQQTSQGTRPSPVGLPVGMSEHLQFQNRGASSDTNQNHPNLKTLSSAMQHRLSLSRLDGTKSPSVFIEQNVSDDDLYSMPELQANRTNKSDFISLQKSPSAGVLQEHRIKGQQRVAREKGEYLACPKCGKEYSESQSKEFLRHIDACTY